MEKQPVPPTYPIATGASTEKTFVRKSWEKILRWLDAAIFGFIDKHRHKNRSRLQTQNKGELMTKKTSAPNVCCTESDWLTPKQAAKYLGITEATLYCWRNRKHPNLVYYKMGGKSVRYRMEDLNKFLSAARIDNAAQ